MEQSNKYGVDPRLIKRAAAVESQENSNPKGHIKISDRELKKLRGFTKYIIPIDELPYIRVDEVN